MPARESKRKIEEKARSWIRDARYPDLAYFTIHDR
jgi:hypothetical protein